ncbi:MAG: haloacid dehalogenase type II [Betaproteobacteria bacterium]|jgi:2-haloacid dehalogenase|nr:haloacid dehalogenase type II [Betaproteobacteria bacterium]
MKPEITNVKALVFDVFGTVVDWRGSISREVRAMASEKKLRVNAAKFADAWRSGYRPAMNRVASGDLPWTKIDDLHRIILDEVLAKFRVSALNEAEKAELNRAWHRLKPWPDTVRGLKRLKKKFTISTLSNGNVALLNNMAKNAGLPWDLILSAEIFHHYKPEPEVYLGAADILGLQPHEILMVAAHKDDLRAAARQGLRTALVLRPNEFGKGRHPDLSPEPAFDINAKDFGDLATQLGA